MARLSGRRRAGTTLVFLYGPPASGKLTVARALAKLTGYRRARARGPAARRIVEYFHLSPVGSSVR